MSLIVQFSDGSKTKIVSWFSATPPMPEQFSNLGEVEVTDPKWKAYYDSINQLSPGMPEPH